MIAIAREEFDKRVLDPMLELGLTVGQTVILNPVALYCMDQNSTNMVLQLLFGFHAYASVWPSC